MSHLDGSARGAAMRAANLLTVLEPFAPTAHAGAVIEVLRRYGEPEPIRITRSDIAGLNKAARALWPIFNASSTEAAAKLLNAILRSYARAPRLSCHDSTSWHLHVDNHDDSPWEEWFASSSAMALAMLLAERQTNPAGICASPRCGRPFIDQGRGDPRRYCSPRCATRERVAAHRRNHRPV